MRYILLIGLLCFSFVLVAGHSWAAPRADDPISEDLRREVAERLSIDLHTIEIGQIRPMNGQAQLLPGTVLQIRPSNPRRLMGRVVFILTMRGAEGKNFVQWVTVDVARIQAVVVTKTALKRHQVIAAEDLEIKDIRFRKKGQTFETEMKDLIGKRMIRSVKSGAPIRMDWVEAAPMIVRGDRITILLEAKGFQMSTLGKAAEDGLHGELIKVMNLDSKKIVLAEVIGEGRVRVDTGFGQKE